MHPPQVVVAPQINVVTAPTMNQAVGVGQRRTSHGFHLIMTLLTGGFWAIFVWIPLVVLRRR